MAIETQERIPSPEEISKDPVKFTEEEINALKNLQVQMDRNTLQLGRINLSKLQLEQQENQIKDNILGLSEDEKELAKNLSDKYGRGSLDIETGTFTPTE
tara:strand:+ start:485 stop:784 length:300 start_codon:yes stop_codon:yes gene_type:complete